MPVRVGLAIVGSICLTIAFAIGLLWGYIAPSLLSDDLRTTAQNSISVVLVMILIWISIATFIPSLERQTESPQESEEPETEVIEVQRQPVTVEYEDETLPKQYRKMLSSVLGMEELIVEDVMLPTSEVIGIDIDKGHNEAIKIIESTGYTRLPVFNKSIENIIGILHLKDSHAFLENLENHKNTKKLLKKAYYVSQSTALMKQLREFLSNDQTIAFAVDEYGEIQGLVSIEDIFKEIVGNFESGKDELEKEFIKLKDGSILTDGNSRIRDINNYLNWEIPEYTSKTINGLVTEQLDQIPQASLCLEIEKYRFEILELDENLISKIKIKKI